MRAALALVAAAGCGFGPFGDTPGGADNLPTLAAGPYEKLPIDFDTPADEPFIAADARASLTGPSALPRSDGGFRVWFARDEDETESEGQIWYTEIPALTELQDVPQDVLIVADQDWEQGDVRDPSVFEQKSDHLVMYYAGGVDEPGIGRAESTDGGRTWSKHPGNPVIIGATSPAAVELGGEIFLAMTRPGEPGIFGATSDSGLVFSTPRLLLSPRSMTPGAFDKFGALQPQLLGEVTEGDRRQFGLFYTGEGEGPDPGTRAFSIGFAGSFDFANWSRFADGIPVLEPGPPNDSHPCALVDTTGGVLFYSEQKQGRGRIAVATHP